MGTGQYPLGDILVTALVGGVNWAFLAVIVRRCGYFRYRIFRYPLYIGAAVLFAIGVIEMFSSLSPSEWAEEFFSLILYGFWSSFWIAFTLTMFYRLFSLLFTKRSE